MAEEMAAVAMVMDASVACSGSVDEGGLAAQRHLATGQVKLTPIYGQGVGQCKSPGNVGLENS